MPTDKMRKLEKKFIYILEGIRSDKVEFILIILGSYMHSSKERKLLIISIWLKILIKPSTFIKNNQLSRTIRYAKQIQNFQKKICA